MMIGDWNNSGVLFGAYPSILASGTGPDPYNTGLFPLYYTGQTVSGTFVDMSVGYGYSSGYLQSDGSGYLLTDYSFSLSPTSIFTIESTFLVDAARSDFRYLCGQIENTGTYWYAAITSGYELEFNWFIDGSGGYVISESGVVTAGAVSTVFFEKNAANVNIYVGSGECVYGYEDTYVVGTGVFTNNTTLLNYNEATDATWDKIYSLVAYDRVLTDSEKNWITENPITYSGLIGYDSGVFLDILYIPASGSDMVLGAYIIPQRKRSNNLMDQYYRGGINGYFS